EVEGGSMGIQRRRCLLQTLPVCAVLAVATSSLAGDNAALIGNPASIAIEPATTTLVGPRSQQQLIVTAKYEGDLLRDLSRVCEFVSENPEVATVNSAGAITPKANGATNVVAKVAGKEAKVAVTVKDMEKPAPVQFVNHVT